MKKKIYRNKDCKECPQNKREDIVWSKGLQDGLELERVNYKKLFWRFYWSKYRK